MALAAAMYCLRIGPASSAASSLIAKRRTTRPRRRTTCPRRERSGPMTRHRRGRQATGDLPDAQELPGERAQTRPAATSTSAPGRAPVRGLSFGITGGDAHQSGDVDPAARRSFVSLDPASSWGASSERDEPSLNVGIGRDRNSPPKVATRAQHVVERFHARELFGGEVGVESFVDASGASEIPCVNEHVTEDKPVDRGGNGHSARRPELSFSARLVRVVEHSLERVGEVIE